jgi:hypothetical protein
MTGVLAVPSGVAALAPAASVAQASSPDGNTALAVVTVAAFFLSVVLAVYVTYQFARGYLRTRQRPLLFLTVGLVLLAPLPMFLRLVFGNVDVVSETERTVLVTASKLFGLLVILGVVYR